MSLPVLSQIRRELRGLEKYEPANPPGISVRMDANESPYELDPDSREALLAHLAGVPIHRYPDIGQRALRATLCAQLGCAPEAICFGNGSDELISVIATSFAEPRPGQPKARICSPAPSFGAYFSASLIAGVEPVPVPLGQDFALDVPALERAIEHHNPNAIFFAYPNNPTGTLWPRQHLIDVLDRRPDILVVSDEAYFELSGATLMDLLPRYPNLLLLRTLSKIGLAGLRIGYAIGHPEVIATLDAVRPPYNTGALNLAAASWLLRHRGDWLRARAAEISSARDRLHDQLGAIPGVHVHPSHANFLLLRLDPPARASRVWAALVQQGVLVHDFDRPGPLAGCLRVTIGTPAQNQAFLAAFRDIMARSGE